MDANKAFQMIEKAFSDKRLVLVTDGTVTHGKSLRNSQAFFVAW